MAAARRRDLWILARTLTAILLLAGGYVLTERWLARYPWYDPRVPFALTDPDAGVIGQWKYARFLSDPAICRDTLAAAGVALPDASLPPVGTDACRVTDRLALDRVLADLGASGSVPPVRLSPAGADASCAVALGLARWIASDVQPAAAAMGSRVVRLRQVGTRNCRTIGGGARLSEHATANAIDIAGFELADGRTLTLSRDWAGDGAEARFLRAARDGACRRFGTTLSPDYNAAHADHLHLDQRGGRAPGYCR